MKYLKDNTKCPQCESRPIKECKPDNKFNVILRHLLKNVDVASKQVLIPVAIIESSCICPICLSLFKETAITKCHHRFCRDCIAKSMGVNSPCKNTCPLCRSHIVSCRSIYPDHAMDLIIEQFKCHHNRIRSKNIFDIVAKPHPTSLQLKSAPSHCADKIYFKISTPDIVTGNVNVIFKILQ